MKFSDKVTSLRGSLIREMNNKANKDSINLGIGMPFCKTSPNIKEAAIAAIHNDKTFYTSNFGIFELRNTIAEDYSKYHTSEISTENIMVTIGVSEAAFLALFSILDGGDEVLLPDPGYLGYSITATMLKCNIKNYTLRLENEFSLDADEIISRVTEKTKVIVLNSPSNPTGGVNSKSELKKLAGFLIDKNIFVISDEVYTNLNFTSEKIPSISDYLPLEKVILLNGVSKEFSMTGWRIGWLISTPENVKQIMKAHQVIASCAAGMCQYAAYEAVKSKNRDVINALAENRTIMDSELKVFKNIRYCVPKGGMFYFVDFSYYGDDLELAYKLAEKINVITIPGFAFGNSGKGFLRLSFGAEANVISNGLRKIRQFLEN